jgi:hypothetical protein
MSSPTLLTLQEPILLLPWACFRVAASQTRIPVSKSAGGGTQHCVAHGGGRRCQRERCSASARGHTDLQGEASAQLSVELFNATLVLTLLLVTVTIRHTRLLPHDVRLECAQLRGLLRQLRNARRRRFRLRLRSRWRSEGRLGRRRRRLLGRLGWRRRLRRCHRCSRDGSLGRRRRRRGRRRRGSGGSGRCNTPTPHPCLSSSQQQKGGRWQARQLVASGTG